jgi:hypothetical protein
VRAFLKESIVCLSLLVAISSPASERIDQDLDASLQKARDLKLTYLPQYIAEQKVICSLGPESSKEKCLNDVQESAVEVFNCPQSQKRFQEGILHDEHMAQDTFLKNKKAEIPQEIRNHFQKLVLAVQDQNGKPFHFNFELDPYRSEIKNAHSSVGGKIYLSDGLWTGQDPLTMLEVTAVMAHEISHVIRQHGMTLNCMAIEWVGPEFNVHDAQEAFTDDFKGSARFDIWSRISQNIEFEADAVATKTLRKAGYDPLLMVQALEKLKPKQVGFTSGSHPDYEIRLQAAQKAALKK